MGSLAVDQANKCAQISTDASDVCLHWQRALLFSTVNTFSHKMLTKKKDNKDERYSGWQIAISVVSIKGADLTMEKQQSRGALERG